jgi:hypothetical protein
MDKPEKVLYLRRRGGPKNTGAAPNIVLSASSITEGSAAGTVVGTLSVVNATGTPAFTLVGTAGGRFVLDGNAVEAAAVATDYETATTHTIEVSVADVVPAIANKFFLITVVNVIEDETPSAFSFNDVTGALLSTIYTSNTITVAGMEVQASVAVTVTGGTYSKNGGAYTSSAGTAMVGDTFAVRAISSGSPSGTVNVALTIGGVSDTFSVTTAGDGVDGAMNFSSGGNGLVAVLSDF